MAQASRRLSTTAGTQPDVLPASQYLQDRLQERRARNTRPRRARQSDFGPTTSGRDDDIFISEGDSKPSRSRAYDSSPLTGSRYAVEETGSRSRGIGSRQLDEQIDRLNKENFDLKLEIDHRRAREHKLNLDLERMRDAVARAEELQEEHTELMRINTDLVQELEKRDEAIQQAVDIITELEEKIEELEDDRHSVTRASTIQADSGYAGTETQEAAPTASPAELLVKASKVPVSPAATKTASRDLNAALDEGSPARAGKRPPTFLTQEKPTTKALRKVFLQNARQLHTVKSFQSILSKHTSTIEDDDGALNSPRLSNISDSSFTSMFNPKKPSPERNAWEPSESTSTPNAHGGHIRQASITRVSQWIEGHNTLSEATSKASLAAHTTAGSARTVTPAPVRESRPIHDALADPLFDPAELLRPELPMRSHTAHPLSESRRGSRTPTSFGGPIFGEPLLTPGSHSGSDSASQRLLRSSRSTIIGEKSVVDSPLLGKGPLAADVSLRTAPKQMRSSVELNTAFVSNLEYRKTGLSNVYHAEEQSPSDDETSIAMRDYFGYPDGNSILCGTPSRFLKHTKPPAADMFFDGNDLSSPEAAKKSGHRRRKSSGAQRSRKPSIVRAETTPAIPLRLLTDLPARPAHADIASPVSFQSSSSNRTIYSKQDARRPLSPDALSPQRKPPSRGTDRVSASPARPTLTQKTHQLFRRLSSSHGSDRTQEPQMSSTPARQALPTLTSTPSSAYINIVPKDMRRTNASHSIDATIRTGQAPVAQVQTPTTARTRTYSDVRNTSATPLTDSAVDKKGFFGRRGSFKAPGLERSKTVNTNNRGRRRSSVKDTLKTGRPWI